MIELTAIGRLTEDIKVLSVNDIRNNKVANFVLACRQDKETEFIQCTAWNEVAETLQKYTKKGSLLAIKGKYKSKEYIEEDTKIKHKRIYFIVEKFEFLEAAPKPVVQEQMPM